MNGAIKMKWTILALICATAACDATASKPPRATASGLGAPHAEFAKYETFTFGPANQPASSYETTARSLEVQRRLTSIVQASLEKRGYISGGESADLVIKISTGSGTMDDEKVQRGNPTDPTSSGFIGVDAYERATGAAVWHGSGVAEVDPQRIDDQLLAKAVELILRDFPARATSGASASLDP
jgi:hypothetical protein